jgi:hypothetical protein
MSTKVITNNQPRALISEWELTEEERKEVNPVEWRRYKTEWKGFRYRGVVYGLREFLPIHRNEALEDWDGYSPETYFSGVLVKLVWGNSDEVIVGSYHS